MERDRLERMRVEAITRLKVGERIYLQKETPQGTLKAWSVQVPRPDGTLEIWFGRVGSAGQFKPVDCRGVEMAAIAGARRVLQKLREGYREPPEGAVRTDRLGPERDDAMVANFSCSSRKTTADLVGVIRSKVEVVARTAQLLNWPMHTLSLAEKVEISDWRLVLNSTRLLPGESMISVLDCAGRTNCRRSRDSLVMLMLLAVRKAAPDGVIVQLIGSDGEIFDPSPERAIEALIANGVRFRELERFVRALRLDNDRPARLLLQAETAGDGFWF